MQEDQEQAEQEVEQETEEASDIPPNLPEGAYQDEDGVWRDRDGNPVGPG